MYMAGRLQSPTEGAWKALEKLVGYLATTMDMHLMMRSQTKSNSFRNRTRGLTTAPKGEEAEHTWLLEVACESDWSGNKQTRSSTSAGCVFLAGNWIHSYARTQKNIRLSSTEAEYVALVSGASEGLLLKAAVEHLTGEQVKLVIYGDNNSSIAIAQKEGVGKLKHLSGRLLWLQQRQSKDLDLRKLDTATNPSDIGAKTLGGKRTNLLMYIMGFTDSSQQLGKTEFEAERAKAEQKRRLQEVRRMVFTAEGTPEKSTQANQLAKRLLRLTMTALLAVSTLGLATAEDQQCFPEDEPQKQSEGLLGRRETGSEMLEQVLMGLTIEIVILSIAILILLKALKNTARELRRHVTSWQALRSAVGGDETYTSDEEQERIGLSTWNAPRRWPENQGNTEWQNWSNWPSGHRTRHENDETSEEPEGRQWVQWAGSSGLTFRDVVGPPWGEEMEEEAQVQDGEVRVSSYIDDEGYAHETEVHVRTVRVETEEERRQRDEDEELENSLTTDYGSLEGHMEPVGEYEHLEDDAYQAYRLEQIENDVGIEVYIIMKVRQFRQMMEEDPADEDIRTGYEMFRELQRMLMITGAETRKEVTDYIRSLIEAVHLPCEERACRCELPFGRKRMARWLDGCKLGTTKNAEGIQNATKKTTKETER